MRLQINFGIATSNFSNYYTDSFSGKHCRQTFPKSSSVVIVISRDTETQSWLLGNYPEIQLFCVINNPVGASPYRRQKQPDWEMRDQGSTCLEETRHLFQVYSSSPNQRGLQPVWPVLGDFPKPLGRHSSVLIPCVPPAPSYKYLSSEPRYC